MSTTLTNIWGTDDWTDAIRLALIRQSALLTAIEPTPVEGKVYHRPRISVYPTAAWLAENTTLQADAGTEDVIVYTPKKIGDSAIISTEAIEDGSDETLNAFAEGLMRGLSHTIDATAFGTAAASATAPQGLLHGLTAVDATGGTSGSAFALDDIYNAVGAIQAVGGNPDVAFINASDLTALRKAKTSTGQYLWLNDQSVTGDVSQAPRDHFAGVQFYVSPGIAAGSMLVADSQFITVAMRRDIRAEFDGSAAFLSDSVAAKVTARLDWGIEDPNAVQYVITV